MAGHPSTHTTRKKELKIKKVDIFPATVLIAPPDSIPNFRDLPMRGSRPQKTRRVDRCRVAIVNSSIYIVVDDPNGPKLVFKENVADYEKDRNNTSHHAITTSGKIITFDKDVNCGCGSRLRSWSPFGSYLSATGDPDA